MVINCGKYTIKSDSYCLWITEKTQGKKKKGKDADADADIEELGESSYERRVAGFSPTFESLLKNFVDRKFRGSDAKTVKQFLTDAANIEKQLKTFVDAIAEEYGLDNVKLGSLPGETKKSRTTKGKSKS